MRIALMQPYLLPYAGYFRLFDVDLFIYHDDSQYVKQSYINRNRLTRHNEEVDWLTLPLRDMPTATKIKDIEFADGAAYLWVRQLLKFKAFQASASLIIKFARHATVFESPVEAINKLIDVAMCDLGMLCPIAQTSYLKLPDSLHGQDRVLAVCEHFKATEYVNASGGKGLYDPAAFRARGIELKILKPYEGNTLSIAERLAFENPQEVRKEIYQNVQFE